MVSRQRRRHTLATALILVSLACVACTGASSGADDGSPEAPADSAAEPTSAAATPTNTLTVEQLANRSYHTDVAGIVELEDGTYTNGPATVELLDTHAIGDVDGDGDSDAAVALSENGGGTGTFLRLIVLTTNEDGVREELRIAAGDRVQLDGLTLAGGTLLADVLTHAEDDPSCCPTKSEQQSHQIDEMLAICRGPTAERRASPLAVHCVETAAEDDAARADPTGTWQYRYVSDYQLRITRPAGFVGAHLYSGPDVTDGVLDTITFADIIPPNDPRVRSGAQAATADGTTFQVPKIAAAWEGIQISAGAQGDQQPIVIGLTKEGDQLITCVSEVCHVLDRVE